MVHYRPLRSRFGHKRYAERRPLPMGLFYAKSIQSIPRGVRFTTTRNDNGEAGFIYLPYTDPVAAGWSSRLFVGGGWWMWQEER